jgi:hypothetical protein
LPSTRIQFVHLRPTSLPRRLSSKERNDEMKGLRLMRGVTAVGLMAVSAQTQVLYSLVSRDPQDLGRFGHSVSGAGDVNNDGYDDVVVGTYWENGGMPRSGTAYIFSGQTGGLLYTLLSPNPENYGGFGSPVSGAGDVNNDGYDDVVVGAHGEDAGAMDAGRAYIFSGVTGAPLYTLLSPSPEAEGFFGYSVSGAGDVNNDGYDDVVVGALGEDGIATDVGSAYIFSGATGAPLHTLASASPEADGSFGNSVSGAGDVNNDGYDDVVVGACFQNGGAMDAGRAYIFSGSTGELLHTLVSPSPASSGRFGNSVSGAGDVNDDGYDDVVVGASEEDGGAFEAGRAYIFSGVTGAPLYTLLSPSPEVEGFFGYSVSRIGDVNSDGHAGVVVGAKGEDGGAPTAGRAHIFSSATGALLYTLLSPNPGVAGYFGESVSGAGDVNNDGYDDVVVGAMREFGGALYSGRAYVFSPMPADMTLIGELVDQDLVLRWARCIGDVSGYWIYGADNYPYFHFELGMTQNRLDVLPPEVFEWRHTHGIGVPDHNWTYLVVAVDCTETAMLGVSNRFGEFDFSSETP